MPRLAVETLVSCVSFLLTGNQGCFRVRHTEKILASGESTLVTLLNWLATCDSGRVQVICREHAVVNVSEKQQFSTADGILGQHHAGYC